MALKATIFKASLQVADMDRHHYQDYNLTIARHPSENDERMMMRVLSFALNAGDDLQFTKGLSTDDEPDLWEKDLTGAVNLWIEVGLPDERRIRKACNQSRQVIIYAYGDRAAPIWREQNDPTFKRFSNLKVNFVSGDQLSSLAEHTERTMSLQSTIQDGHILVSSDSGSTDIELQHWV
ncbi:YaeQ family protein [Sansalvadorimonas sp. 2012CJ34-2]|uniref:YaeQ family protein n=1 Tax=Parendozoicomonas callyspongiae TaxID=2942213 RepID=A0ABT0PB90_9GAMM|nr:YaeQ family protein [Sansalvadorimonas sp. 2012CJ34-2]MCL6268585.1 YaeQ family protein [Sansalvadorimonas sp. 2012CJ34-2]